LNSNENQRINYRNRKLCRIY